MSHDHEQVCYCIGEHRPEPLELVQHHIWPQGLGGPDIAENLVWVCPTTHYNIHELLRAMIRESKVITRYEFSSRYDVVVNNYAVMVAQCGFRWMREPKVFNG